MQQKLFIYFTIILSIQKIACTKYGMTKIECKVVDDKLVQFDACDLVPVSKKTSELTVKVRVLKKPIKNLKLRVAVTVPGVMTVYNDTWDVCALLSKRKSNRAFNDWIRPGLTEFTNINHSCPYDIVCMKLGMTKIECQALEPKLVQFEACELVAASQTLSELTVKVRVLKFPVRQVMVGVAITFPGVVTVYNDTWDICGLLKKRRNNRAFNDWIRPGLKQFTNINHSCPYYHDIHIKKMPQPATEAKFAVFGNQFLALVDASLNGKKVVLVKLTYSERV